MIYYYASPLGSGAGLSVNDPTSLQSAKTMAQSASASDDVTVYLIGGTYSLTSTLAFTSADSGKNGFRVYWKSILTPPVFSGGVAVTGWTLHDAGKNIWKVQSPNGLTPRQLYVNDKRAIRVSLDLATISFTFGSSFSSSDPNLPALSSPSSVEYCFYGLNWAQSRSSISGYTRVGNVTTFNVDANVSGWFNPNHAPSLENAFEFLTGSTYGSWCFDGVTSTIYYVPLQGESVNSVPTIIPAVTEIATFNGVTDVTFDGVIFAHSCWDGPRLAGGYLHVQAGSYGKPAEVAYQVEQEYDVFSAPWYTPPAGVETYHVQRLVFTNCKFTHMGAKGLYLGEGSKNNLIHGCEFYDISSNGLQIGTVNDSYAVAPSLADQVSYNVANNNKIHSCGIEYIGSIGAMVGYTDHTRLLHNEVYDTPYTGISLGWGWASYPNGFAKGHEIAWNKIYRVMSDKYISDGGGIYSLGTQGQNDHTSVHHNFLFDIGSNSLTPTLPTIAGLYPDEGTQYEDFFNNVVLQSLNGCPVRWLYCNSVASINTIVAHDNYANSGMVFGPVNQYVAAVNTANVLPSSNPSDWDVIPAQVANAAGISPITVDSVSVPSGGSAIITGSMPGGATVQGVSGAGFGTVSYPTSSTWTVTVSGMTAGSRNLVAFKTLSGSTILGTTSVMVNSLTGPLAQGPKLRSPSGGKIKGKWAGKVSGKPQ